MTLLQGHLQGRRSLYSEDFLKNMGVEASAGVKTFADETRISAVCAEYVDLLSSLDIMVGDENNKFQSKQDKNRAEMAVIVTKTNNMLNSMKCGS